MLIEEVDNLANNHETCSYCDGSGYHPKPSREEIQRMMPGDPVPCPYCFGLGKLDVFGDDVFSIKGRDR